MFYFELEICMFHPFVFSVLLILFDYKYFIVLEALRGIRKFSKVVQCGLRHSTMLIKTK